MPGLLTWFRFLKDMHGMVFIKEDETMPIKYGDGLFPKAFAVNTIL
jgi:hypothetical protein